MHTATVKVVELARESIEAKHNYAAMSSRQENLKAKPVKIHAAPCMMIGQISEAKERVKSRKTPLTETYLAQKKLKDKFLWMEAELQAETNVAEEFLWAMLKRVERLGRELVT